MNRKILAGLTVAAALSAPLTNAGAAPILYAANGHSYEFISANLDWDEANAAAQLAGGYLATVTDGGENAFISGLVGGLTAWLGGSDSGTEGIWKWMDGPEAGQTFVYENWHAGEPNDVGGEDYLVMNHPTWFDGTWNDTPGTLDNRGYVIEYSREGDGIPEPAALGLLVLGLIGMGIAARRRRRS